MTAREEVCALVDGMDAFDPASGESAGIDPARLLWVRCRNLDQVLRSTDLLLQAGGFGLVGVDVSDLPPHAVHHIPLACWFRFQRIIENTPTILLLIGRERVAKSAASLVLHTSMDGPLWTGALPALETGAMPAAPAHGNLLGGNDLHIEIVRSRNSEAAHSRLPHHVCVHSRS
jgi:hypothetical protein